DVANSARRSLDVAGIGSGFHPSLEDADAAYRVGIQGFGPQNLFHQLLEVLADPAIACRPPGLQQGLELPGFRPTRVVGAVGLERSGEWTAAPIGSPIGIGA